jgi:homoserine acetyltransferase
MAALSFAAEFPDVAERVVAIACTGRSSPGSVALRRIQRHAVLLDPQYRGGRYAEQPARPAASATQAHGPVEEEAEGEARWPVRGMLLARELGMVTYRSLEEFNQRFAWAPELGPERKPHFSRPCFEVERYLESKGAHFARSFDPNCFLLLSACSDLMDLGRGFSTFSEGVLRIGSAARTRLLFIASQFDMLIPASELQSLAQLLQAHGRNATYLSCPSVFGHDAFLLDTPWFAPRLRAFLYVSTLFLFALHLHF